jgi:cyclopropane fatty-acyl-phospholipid synthase-like methyltransferase
MNGGNERDAEYYEDFYALSEKSGAYSEYCDKLFGCDFTQQGFADTAQLDRMLHILDIKPGESVLDIGCGNGSMLEYICGKTGARGTGFDVSAMAIEQAKQRAHDNEMLSFECADVNEKQYADSSFDAVLAMDTAYFTADLNKTAADIYRWLKPGGRFAAFYSAFRFSPEDAQHKLSAHGTAMAQALKCAGIKYYVNDFTKSHYEHMKKKRAVLQSLKQRFEAERMIKLYDNAFIESISEDMSYEEFRAFSSRYLYYAVKPL